MDTSISGLVKRPVDVTFLSVDHISDEDEPGEATAPIKPHSEWERPWAKPSWTVLGLMMVWSLLFGGLVTMLCFSDQDLQFRRWRYQESDAADESKRAAYSSPASTPGTQTLAPFHGDEAKGDRILSTDELRQQPAWQDLNHRLEGRQRYIDKLEEQIRDFDERLDQQHFARSRWEMAIQWLNLGVLFVYVFLVRRTIFARRTGVPKIH